MMENSCDYVWKHLEDADFGITLTLADEHQQEFVIELPKEKMLRDGGPGLGYDHSCVLPFYKIKDAYTKTWVVGSIILEDYYSVYDFTNSNGNIATGLGKKDPTFDYTAGGGGGPPDNIKK